MTAVHARAGVAVPARVRVWDLPTRLFHWSLTACIVGSIVSAKIGGNAFAWHFRFGYAILALVLFRLAWGFAGPRYARFASFPPNPAAAWRRLRGEGDAAREIGHGPLGALSVYAMLASVALQAGTGLFASDDILWDGPLKDTVSNAMSATLTAVHLVNRYVLIALIVLHLAAITWYARARRRPLVRAMIDGNVPLASREARSQDAWPPVPAADDAGVRASAALLLGASAALVWAVVT
ncbi:MAG: cytochrome b/b6 domain-containing protein [Burkholderiaceae bacterium]|nr:cytochrome b/b6 domain-containing protein [Burkholderiaceae bacterium]